jgi:hypothetical protein
MVAALRAGAPVAAVSPTAAAAHTDRDLYRRRDSPSPDRYHGIQAIIRGVGPGGGWPTLPKTNYVEWATVMRVRLQVWHMWETVRYGDVDYYKNRWALDALIAAVPFEMQFSLSKKRTAKEWENLAFKLASRRLSVLTLCSRRWCSSATTPTARREQSRSSSGASPRSTSRSIARSSLCWTSPRCQSKRR